MKEYYFQDLEALSATAREVWLAEQCSEFESLLRELSNKHQKEHLVEDLYKKLKQVTRRWQSWNHRSFGAVTSRGYVAELQSWERNIKIRGILLPKPQAASPENNALEKFEDWCQDLEDLHNQFTTGILQPLKDFFICENTTPQLKSVPRDLEKVLSQWYSLLTSGAVNDKLFTSGTGDSVYPVSIRNRCHDFDLVLRLIPDLMAKAHEALRLARRWRLMRHASANLKRDETYIVGKNLNRSHRRRQGKVEQRLKSLEQELEQSQAHYKALKKELEESNAKCEAIERELTNYRQQCKHLENELDRVKVKCESLKEKLENAKRERKSVDNDNETTTEYIKVLQQELNSAKMNYCVQKIKFINAKRRCATLANELDSMKERLIILGRDLEESKKKCQALRLQLDNTKKNIFTQGHMLDVLQNQCFTLRDELQASKSKCTELSGQLETSTKQCESLVKQLELVKQQCQTLDSELQRAKTREELLIKQNEHLRNMCEEQGIPQDPVLHRIGKNTLHKPETDSLTSRE
ncbi:myosin-2 isoform X2 [Nematostella vectensis]|uniref:myosin-2 isoform X2 n=1 Tax=Nematostella vectensis TaxID=45351 RepID=UPI00138FB898|nr:myosin-2 isoform X2 [Nematostella vectensis]